MLADELKAHIIKNDLIEPILEDLGCIGVKEQAAEWRCGLPNDTNKNRISVKKDSLKIRIFKSNEETVRGDIFTLCMDIKNFDFYSSNKYLHELLGLKFDIGDIRKKTENNAKCPLDIFRRVQRRRAVVNHRDIEVYDDSIIKEYDQLPHISWIREGIMPPTCKKFNIGYSFDRQRIVIPERLWNGKPDEYVGIMGRTTIEEYEMLDIPKYFPLKKFYKGLNLYGLQENYKDIQEANYVTVFEAQKSVLKRHSLFDKTGVSLGSHDITDEQVRILIGLDVEIIIALDKGISINHVRSVCDKFYGIRKVSYIWDKYDLIQGKDSPADCNNKVYNYLFKYKVNYDEEERRLLHNWLENREKN